MLDWIGYLGVLFVGFCIGFIVMAGAAARSYERGRTEGAAHTRQVWQGLQERSSASWARHAGRLEQDRSALQSRLREERQVSREMAALVDEMSLKQDAPGWEMGQMDAAALDLKRAATLDSRSPYCSVCAQPLRDDGICPACGWEHGEEEHDYDE